MKKIFAVFSIVILGYFILDSYSNKKVETLIEKAMSVKKGKKKIKVAGMGIGSDNAPQNRRNWTASRLVNPETGKMPANMRARELAFAQGLPQNLSVQTDWSARGPYNVGGRTRAMAIDITDENVILAGGVSGGVWRSENSGASWIKLTSPEMLHNVTCLRQDQREGHTDTWYYGSGEAYGNSAAGNDAYFFGNGIYKTDDNGLTWHSLTSTASNSPVDFDDIWDLVWDVEVDHSNDTLDVVYAATYGAIHRSEDGGENWTKVLGSSSNSSYFTEVEITSSGIVYAALSSDGYQKGIWRSENGLDWNDITPDEWPNVYDRIKIAINPSDENEVYFIAVTPGEGQESITFLDEVEHCSLWKYRYHVQNSSPQMGMWVNKSDFIPTGIGTNFDNFYAQGSYDLMIAVSPADENHVFIGGTNLYVSTDGFSSMENVNQIGGYQKGTSFPDFQIYETHHPDQHEVAFVSSASNTLISANDGGVFKTTNYLAEDVVWSSLNNGYYSTQLYTATINEKQVTNSLLGGFQDNGNFYTNSTDELADWVMPLNGDGAFAHFVEDESVSYMSIQKGKVFKIEMDEQGNRIAHRRIDPAGAENQLFIHPFVVDPSDENMMYYPDGRSLWRNTSLNDIELSNEWDSISGAWEIMMDSLDIGATYISSIAVSNQNPPHRLYVGTSKQMLYRIDSAHTQNPIITDVTSYHVSGTTPGTSFNSYAYINNIAIHPEDADVAMAVMSNYETYSLYYTTNGGEHWERASGNLEESLTGSGDGPSCRWASIMPFGEDTLYFVATSTGLYATEKLESINTTWMQMGENSIGNVVCEQVKTRAADSLLVLATHGNGIYTTKIQSVDEVIEVAEFEQLSTLTVYPNPASDFVIIESNCSEKGELYDVSGRLIEAFTLDNHKVKIDISHFETGVYICKVGSETKKWIKR